MGDLGRAMAWTAAALVLLADVAAMGYTAAVAKVDYLGAAHTALTGGVRSAAALAAFGLALGVIIAIGHASDHWRPAMAGKWKEAGLYAAAALLTLAAGWFLLATPARYTWVNGFTAVIFILLGMQLVRKALAFRRLRLTLREPPTPPWVRQPYYAPQWFADPPGNQAQREVRDLLEARDQGSYASLVRTNRVVLRGSDGHSFELRRRVGGTSWPAVVDERGHFLCVNIMSEQGIPWEDTWLGMARWIIHDAPSVRAKGIDSGPIGEVEQGMDFRMESDTVLPVGPDLTGPETRHRILETRTDEDARASVDMATAYAERRWTGQFGHVYSTKVVRGLLPRDLGLANWTFHPDPDYFAIERSPQRCRICLDYGLCVPDGAVWALYGVTVDPRLPTTYYEMEIWVGRARHEILDLHTLYLPSTCLVKDGLLEYRFSPTGYLDAPLVLPSASRVQIMFSGRAGGTAPGSPFMLALEGLVVEPEGHTIVNDERR